MPHSGYCHLVEVLDTCCSLTIWILYVFQVYSANILQYCCMLCQESAFLRQSTMNAILWVIEGTGREQKAKFPSFASMNNLCLSFIWIVFIKSK